MYLSCFRSLRTSLARFVGRSEGSVLPIFTLALIPVVGMAGAAVDYSRASNARSHLQASLDVALLAGARDGTPNWINVATDVFNANVKSKDASVGTPTFSLDANRAYKGSVSAAMDTQFMGVVGVKNMDISVSGTATVASVTGSHYCVLALNPTERSSMMMTGNASITINAPKCVIQVNSNDTFAVDMNGNTVIKSVENCFVGGLRTVGNATITPEPNKTCDPVPDPFTAYPRPTVGPCLETNYAKDHKDVGNTVLELEPGVYCGGMKFAGPLNVKFKPGLFVIKDGVISEDGGTFNGTGVTFFLTGAGAGIQLSGQANWHIVAPVDNSKGGMPGFAIFLEPNGPTGKASDFSTLSGQAELYFEGIVYLPKQRVTVTGNATAIAPSPYTSYIGDTLHFVGNGELIINNDLTKTTLPVPTALMVQTGGRLALTQ
jgi:Flp pilus assembly protein TadG